MHKKFVVKTALLISAVLFFDRADAQTFKEDFNSTSAPKLPTGWIQWNLDKLTVKSDLDVLGFKTNAWISANLDQTNTCMISTSHYQSAGTSDDWLVTPPIKPVAGDYLSWDAMNFEPKLKDGYEVRISTTDSLPASFTKVLFSVKEEVASNPTTHIVDLSAYANKRVYIAFRNNSNDKYVMMIDNVLVSKIPKLNAGLKSISPIAGSTKAFAQKGSNMPISVELINKGVDTIKSGFVRYSDGKNVYSTPITQKLPYNSIVKMDLTAYSVTSLNTVNIKAWVEVSGDVSVADDTLKTAFAGTSFWPKHRVTIEEGTGTWCGWCPRGAVFLDSARKKYNDDVVLVAVHNKDPMTVTAYDEALAKFIPGFPRIIAERKMDDDPSFTFNAIDNLKSDCGIADVSILSIKRGSTVTVNASVKYAINSVRKDNWRLALVITEDGVRGTGSQYDQHNYYSNSQGQMSGAGHNWIKEPDPIPAARMVYDHVARYNSGFNGVAGSLPDTLIADKTYNYTFTLPLPASVQHEWMCHANVLLINQTTGEIVNAATQRFTPLSINNIEGYKNINVYPNPVSGICHVDLPDATINKISIYDGLGRLISVDYNYDGQTVSFDVNNINNGIYTVIIETQDGIYSSKFLK